MKFRYFYPLIGFVVQTVVVAYFFVIPHSCIAGVNHLTIGFAGTIAGDCLTYFLGVHSVLRPPKPIT
jgi:hypothetical protein